MTRTQIALAALIVTFSVPALFAQQWTQPTPEELSMTSIPQVPGAAAVILYEEEKTDDALHSDSHYSRIKVLTEGGKEQANVELRYVGGDRGWDVSDVSGRTIQPDGTVVPFTGKPYDKLVVKAGDIKVKEKVFTLPAVQVGSILEYRYKLRWDDNLYRSPDWYIQGDLYVRKAHYDWRPTHRTTVDSKGNVSYGGASWTPFLPEGAKVVQTSMPNDQTDLTLDVHDIAPLLREADMPPMQSLSYRVLFYYSSYHTYADFWKENGKDWSKDRDKFIGPNGAVKEYAATLVSPGDSEQQKADKLYAAVMTFDNTDFTREHSTREDKAQGLKQVNTAGDIVQRRRGDSDQLAETYVALARAAGLKAYVMGVADRRERLFVLQYMSFGQIDDLIAIVNLGGKEVFYDPGERYCEPGHLAWQHAGSGGLRQVDGGGTALVTAPGESYKAAHLTRIADLTMDEHGRVEGTVKMSFTGDPALHWRQVALRGDETTLKNDLRVSLERMLPGGMEIEVKQVENVAEYTKPLEVQFAVKGGVGTATGKRLLVPADLFVANEKPRFAQAQREIPVDIHYASQTQDAVRYKLPANLTIESVPDPDRATMAQLAMFQTDSKKSGNSVTLFRNVTIGSPVFYSKEYPDLRAFYSKLETRDQDTLVLTRATTTAAAQTGAAPSTK